MNFIETHCHLDDDAFSSDLPEVLERARTAGVELFVNIGYEPKSWKQSIELAQAHPDVAYALGMHPNAADQWTSDAAAMLSHLLETTKPVAIGETGLDFFRDSADRSAQRTAFRDQLGLGRRFALPVVIHMRGEVEDEIIDNLSDFPDVRVIFHSFEGSARLRDFSLERGDLIGAGGLMTRAGSAMLRDILQKIPLDSLVLETDSPYLVPSGMKDRRNTPAAIPVIAAALAELLEVAIEEVAERTSHNARAVFRLDGAMAAPCPQ